MSNTEEYESLLQRVRSTVKKNVKIFEDGPESGGHGALLLSETTLWIIGVVVCLAVIASLVYICGIKESQEDSVAIRSVRRTVSRTNSRSNSKKSRTRSG